MLLASSDTKGGAAYVQTANLDGETNLKLRSAVDATRSLESADISVLRGSCQHEAPNRNLYKFEGLLSLSSGVSAALDNDNILLRGSQLRNTKHAYGLVVFTGKDTKIIRNSAPAPSKRSRIERVVDKTIYVILFILMVYASIGAIIFAISTEDIRGSCAAATDGSRNCAWYMSWLGLATFNPATSALEVWVTQFILLNNVVPISLYVTVEFAKVLQARLINSDLEMYYEEEDM